MTRLRPLLPWFSRLALGLLLALALLPSLSQALADAQAAGPWAELCSSLGGKRMLLADASPGGSAPAPALHGEHCPLCGNAPLGLPPAARGGVPVLVGATSHPPLFAQSPRPLFAWLAAQPRGPPAQA